MDTPPDPSFDELAELAARLCQTPIALVCLADHDRLWFKAHKGLDIREVPRHLGFCSHALLNPDAPLILRDAAQDPRFAENPLVVGGPRLRFYAGVPLVNDEGLALGTLCVMDHVPRSMDEAAIEGLRMLGRQVMAQIQLRERTLRTESLNRALEQAYQRAEATSSARASLLAVASHEFRTPMNGVLGLVSLLLATPLSVEQREMVETLQSSSQQLLHLINQLLDFSTLEAERLGVDLQPVPPLGCLDEVVQMLGASAADKGLRLLVHVDPSVPTAVVTNGDKLRRVCVNLLSNAIKFTPRGDIQIELGPHEDGRLQVAVIDAGPGIPGEHIGRLFQPFYRIPSSSHLAPGTGLGLAICKRLIEQLRGEIRVDNVSTGGARFSFAIPAAAAPSAPPRPLVGKRVAVQSSSPPLLRATLSRLRWWGAEAVALARGGVVPAGVFDLVFFDDAPPPLEAPTPLFGLHEEVTRADGQRRLQPPRWSRLLARLEPLSTPSPSTERPMPFDEAMARRFPLEILLVEDNPVNRYVTLKTLARLGYQARAVSDGSQALEAVQAAPCDVVLMDLHMPGLDGIGAASLVRAAGLKARIVAVTASASERDREACLAAGMDDYLSKPMLLPDLIRVLHRAYDALHPGER